MKSSLQVDVSQVCDLNCQYCVAKMNPTFHDYKKHDWEPTCLISDLQKARKTCDIMVLTGTGEPLRNMNYLEYVLYINKLHKIFDNIELQTNGQLLSHSILKRLRDYGVTVVAVSCANPFDQTKNKEITKGVIDGLGSMINAHGFTSRLTVVLNKGIENYTYRDYYVGHGTFIDGYQQLTFKRMWRDGYSQISKWIEENDCTDSYVKYLMEEFGDFANVRVDNNCMGKDWLVLRPWGLCDSWHEGPGGKVHANAPYSNVFYTKETL